MVHYPGGVVQNLNRTNGAVSGNFASGAPGGGMGGGGESRGLTMRGYYDDNPVTENVAGNRNFIRIGRAVSGPVFGGGNGEMETRTLRLPTNMQGLGGVISGGGGIGGGIGGIGGGGIGGGGIGGIGGGGIGGGGIGGYGGGGGAGSQQQGSASYPTVSAAPASGGGAGGTHMTGGIPYATSPREVLTDGALVFRYLTNAGVNIGSNGAFAFYNDRSGDLLVRASKEDLDKIERSAELLNETAQETPIDARFASVTPNDTKGVAFQTYLGNYVITNYAGGNLSTSNGVVEGNIAGSLIQGDLGNVTIANGNLISRLDGVSPYREVGGPGARKAEGMGADYDEIIVDQSQYAEPIGRVTDLLPQQNGRTSTSCIPAECLGATAAV